MKNLKYDADPNSKGMIAQMRTSASTAVNLTKVVILVSKRTPYLLDNIMIKCCNMVKMRHNLRVVGGFSALQITATSMNSVLQLVPRKPM